MADLENKDQVMTPADPGPHKAVGSMPAQPEAPAEEVAAEEASEEASEEADEDPDAPAEEL